MGLLRKIKEHSLINYDKVNMHILKTYHFDKQTHAQAM